VLAAFWSNLGGEFTRQWAARVLTPAFAFWAGGLAAVWWHMHADRVREQGWTRQLAATAAPVGDLPGVAQGVLVVGGLLLLAVSALVADRLTLPLLRLLEGYWARPRWARRLLVAYRRALRRRWSERVDALALRQRRGLLSVAEYAELRRLAVAPGRDAARLTELAGRRARGFGAEEGLELARGQRFLRGTPVVDAAGMPTRLGDLLRAAERRPLEKYGLDAAVCWNALWLVLPDAIRTELAQARASLDNATRAWLWGALFLVWTPWTWWAVPVGLVIPVLAYYVGMMGAAAAFGDLVVTAFDLYRMRLYDGLCLPRPTGPDEERRRSGPRATNALWGGLDGSAARYTSGAPPAPGDEVPPAAG
jgi:hypothetical protein